MVGVGRYVYLHLNDVGGCGESFVLPNTNETELLKPNYWPMTCKETKAFVTPSMELSIVYYIFKLYSFKEFLFALIICFSSYWRKKLKVTWKISEKFSKFF